jgi:hypothetical protein
LLWACGAAGDKTDFRAVSDQAVGQYSNFGSKILLEQRRETKKKKLRGL